MLRFRKVASENLKNRETSRYVSNFKFSGVICNEFWLKVELIRIKTCLWLKFEREEMPPM